VGFLFVWGLIHAVIKGNQMGKRGGKRPGAGRKPKALTDVRAKAIAAASADAEYGLGLVIQVMQNAEYDIDLRLQCANEVMDRVWGKATQRHEIEGDLPVHITVNEAGITAE
jgi:hypothetical protein